MLADTLADLAGLVDEIRTESRAGVGSGLGFGSRGATVRQVPGPWGARRRPGTAAVRRGRRRPAAPPVVRAGRRPR